MIQKLKTFLLDLILPRRCIGCDRVDTWWCEECFHLVHENPIVSFHEAPLDRLIIATHYDDPLIKKAISTFKYQRHPEDIAEKLGKILAKALGEHTGTLIPVPLDRQREKERGFNQAELLCQAMAKHSHLQLKTSNQLTKDKSTLPQVGLSRQERLSNIYGVFSLANPLQSVVRYILIDDVVTTGATLKECARVLKKHGAIEVWGLAVARNAI